MADNIPVTPGTGAIIAAEDVGGGILVQKVKLTAGPANTATDLLLGRQADAASLAAALSTEDAALIAAITTAVTSGTLPTGAGTPAAAGRVVTALASTGNQTSVSSSASDTTLLAANAARLGYIIYNDSTSVLNVLAAAGTSSATLKSYVLQPGQSASDNAYAGIIKGIWASANGAARVTEFV